MSINLGIVKLGDNKALLEIVARQTAAHVMAQQTRSEMGLGR